MLRLINLKLISKVLGLLFYVESLFMLFSLLIAILYQEDVYKSFIASALFCLGCATIFSLYGWKSSRFLGKREGYLIVFLSWLSVSFIGTFPFYISGYIPSFADAFFETVSGFTTTGATILKDIERLPHSLLFWRSVTHWLGGMGIIVFTLALLPLFKNGGLPLFMAESTGPKLTKIHPRIAEASQRLWSIYIFLTLLCGILLYGGGMSLFDATCHAFSTLSSGGFSTKNASISFWDSPGIHYTTIAFMLIASINFNLLYYLLKRKWGHIQEDEELKWYLTIIASCSLFIGGCLYFHHYDTSLERCLRDALFQVVSIISGTGFATSDYMQWHPLLWTILLLTMICGGSAGSTSGGVKTVRILLMFKLIRNEFNRFIHPNAVLPVKLNRHVVAPQILSNVLVFLVVYILVILFSVLILTMSGMPFIESIGASISSIGNIGPAIGELGPTYTFADIPSFAKVYLSFLMIVGRLEIFTVLLIFTPYFWRD